jgi:hypothetical protein
MAKAKVQLNRGALRRALRPGLERIAREYTDELNRLGQQYRGRPIEELKAALVELHRRRGGSITEPELTRYAETLAAGRRITPRLRG